MKTAYELTGECCEYKMLSFLLPALINGDYTGLDDEEVEKIRTWESLFAPNGAVYEVEKDSIEDFCLCDVTGEYGQCETVFVTEYRTQG